MASELGVLRERRHLFLGGGGYKTLGFLAVLDAIGWQQWHRAVGVSAGALIALMLVLGYSLNECQRWLLTNEDVLIESVAPAHIWRGRSPLSPDLAARVTSSILARKGFRPETTMAELKARRAMNFGAVAFCIDTSRLVMFAPETHPTTRVTDVIAASIAIPLLLPPVCPDGTARYYDAGLVNSAPLGFCEASGTLALVVRPSSELCAAFPETAQFRCHFIARMSMELARSRGMRVLQVPFPSGGVSLLSRNGTSLSVFLEHGALYVALYVIRHEFLGLLALWLCRP
jgi:predicted acylesterase/phospholipase RssA